MRMIQFCEEGLPPFVCNHSRAHGGIHWLPRVSINLFHMVAKVSNVDCILLSSSWEHRFLQIFHNAILEIVVKIISWWWFSAFPQGNSEHKYNAWEHVFECWMNTNHMSQRKACSPWKKIYMQTSDSSTRSLYLVHVESCPATAAKCAYCYNPPCMVCYWKWPS